SREPTSSSSELCARAPTQPVRTTGETRARERRNESVLALGKRGLRDEIMRREPFVKVVPAPRFSGSLGRLTTALARAHGVLLVKEHIPRSKREVYNNGRGGQAALSSRVQVRAEPRAAETRTALRTRCDRTGS